MSKPNIVISCICCGAPNKISMGNNMHQAKTFYTCYNCGRSASVSITQCQIPDNPVHQRGAPVTIGMSKKEEESN